MEKHRKLKILRCKNCGKEWKSRGRGITGLCRSCLARKAALSKPIGKDNPCWRGGYKFCRKNRVESNRKWAIEYKGGKCQVCGNGNLVLPCYHLHHIGKKNRLMNHYLNGSKEKLRIELDKCILLCANCHITLHYNNGTFGKELGTHEVL